jgi:hypothetical protein
MTIVYRVMLPYNTARERRPEEGVTSAVPKSLRNVDLTKFITYKKVARVGFVRYQRQANSEDCAQIERTIFNSGGF